MTTSPYPSRRSSKRKKPSLFIRFIGVLGELMITVSLVIGLFIFWQLYWTSWEVEADRDQAISDFEAQLPKVPVEKVAQARTDALSLIHI